MMDYNQHGDPASWRCHPLDPRGQQFFIGEGTPKERALGGHDLICVFSSPKLDVSKVFA